MVAHAALRLPQRLSKLAGRRRPLREETDDLLPRRIADRPELVRPPHLEDLVQLVVQALALPAHRLILLTRPTRQASRASPSQIITCKHQSLKATGLRPPDGRDMRRASASRRTRPLAASCLCSTILRACCGSKPEYTLSPPNTGAQPPRT